METSGRTSRLPKAVLAIAALAAIASAMALSGAVGAWVFSLLDDSGDMAPLATAASSPLRAPYGPTSAIVVAERVVPGEEYWSGMAMVETEGDEAVTIESASVLTSEGARPVGVYLAVLGEGGGTGATPRVPPGNDLPGDPAPAAGFVVEPGGEPTVVYAVAALEPGVEASYVLGASLTVQVPGGGSKELTVLSPVVLCPNADSENTPACMEAKEAMLERVAEISS